MVRRERRAHRNSRLTTTFFRLPPARRCWRDVNYIALRSHPDRAIARGHGSLNLPNRLLTCSSLPPPSRSRSPSAPLPKFFFLSRPPTQQVARKNVMRFHDDGSAERAEPAAGRAGSRMRIRPCEKQRARARARFDERSFRARNSVAIKIARARKVRSLSVLLPAVCFALDASLSRARARSVTLGAKWISLRSARLNRQNTANAAAFSLKAGQPAWIYE